MSKPISELKVRAFEEADRASVVLLWQRCFPDDPPWNEPAALLTQKLSNQPELLLVGYIAGELVGTIVGGYDGVRGWMYHLAAAPEFRRRGVGSSLVRSLEEALRKLGCVKLNLQVREGNVLVSAFYESLGYRVEPRLSLGKRLDDAR